ncbi:hypothetical protein M422DRAFT_255682 [Sphaerobolus stellatus SS14]|uniref:Protein kinase domain-containing protein n=1 Tax=Sphaerobolus stellatus (strain SS14) TaxID=990650 RepID=A0A0C9UDN4_SPHS4|nr:hypothetical protein M422DRAFT_255682 [Sphaerobolus stellatus SS14]
MPSLSNSIMDISTILSTVENACNYRTTRGIKRSRSRAYESSPQAVFNATSSIRRWDKSTMQAISLKEAREQFLPLPPSYHQDTFPKPETSNSNLNPGLKLLMKLDLSKVSSTFQSWFSDSRDDRSSYSSIFMNENVMIREALATGGNVKVSLCAIKGQKHLVLPNRYVLKESDDGSFLEEECVVHETPYKLGGRFERCSGMVLKFMPQGDLFGHVDVLRDEFGVEWQGRTAVHPKAGYFHENIKLENLMLDNDGGLLLADFGTANEDEENN